MTSAVAAVTRDTEVRLETTVAMEETPMARINQVMDVRTTEDPDRILYERSTTNTWPANTVEMAPLAQNAGPVGQAGGGNLLGECADINRGIDDIEQKLNQMKMLQQRALSAADTGANSTTSRQLDSLSSETMALYRALTERVRQLKSNPASQQSMNAPQVGRVDRRLKQAIQSYQQLESQFRNNTQDQMARQYRIVRPEADEAEVQAAVEDPTGGQVFQQALMQSNRRGQAQSVLSAVQDRHAQLEKIERDIIELAQLFQDMDTLVIQQEVAITNIEQKAEETVEHFDKGNEQLVVAVDTARKTRRKKWMCLGLACKLQMIIREHRGALANPCSQYSSSLSSSSLLWSTCWSLISSLPLPLLLPEPRTAQLWSQGDAGKVNQKGTSNR
jgi:syntaxin 1B/2/3